jgi:hypothetical protein
MRVITLIEWQSPTGEWHKPGAVEDVSVFDLDDLIRIGTVAPAPEPAIVPAPTKPAAPIVPSAPVTTDSGNGQ